MFYWFVVGFYTPTIELINKFAQYLPQFKLFFTGINAYIRRLEEASLAGNTTIAINTIQEGINEMMKLLPKLSFNQEVYNMAKSAPAAGKGLIQQIKLGTRDPRDINTALGIFYYKMRELLPKQSEPLRINLIQPKGPKSPLSSKGLKGLKSLKSPK